MKSDGLTCTSRATDWPLRLTIFRAAARRVAIQAIATILFLGQVSLAWQQHRLNRELGKLVMSCRTPFIRFPPDHNLAELANTPTNKRPRKNVPASTSCHYHCKDRHFPSRCFDAHFDALEATMPLPAIWGSLDHCLERGKEYVSRKPYHPVP